MILIFLFVPETRYPRDLHKSIDAAGVPETGESLSGQETPPSEMNETKAGAGTMESVETVSPEIPKKSFLQEIKPWSPVRKDVSLVASFVRPWATWCYPSVVWSVFSFSIHVTG